jgi:hypothetical protein
VDFGGQTQMVVRPIAKLCEEARQIQDYADASLKLWRRSSHEPAKINGPLAM